MVVRTCVRRCIFRGCGLRLGSRYIEIPDASHSAYLERPKEWNAAVLGFVGGVGD